LQYRREIDGLRAVAIFPVILFHSGLTSFSGGYVGVDVFFVISGFLITNLIMEEIQQAKFSLTNFYERRARRIFPALSAMLILTTLAAYLLLAPDTLKDYSDSLFFVVIFLSNLFFFVDSGYFSAAADEKPLLHTWSLAVEEQYYLFFPLLVILLWRKPERWLILTLVTLSLASLLLSKKLAADGSTDANYYLIFSRAWELLFGSLLALTPINRERMPAWLKELLSLSGIVMIGYAVTQFDSNTPFPSLYTLIPVLGSCLIIAFACPQLIVSRLLNNKLAVAIGLISYSLYLWHQPLLALLRLKSAGEPSRELLLLAIALTFILALLSWRFVEKPFRNRKKFSRRQIFRYTSISIVLFMAIGITGHHNKGFKQRFPASEYATTMTPSPIKARCHADNKNYISPDQSCRYFVEDNTRWATLGDSHIPELAYALAQRLERSGVGLRHLSYGGCAPSLTFEVNTAGCSLWIKDAVNFLVADTNIENVVIGFRYSEFLFGGQRDAYPEAPNEDPTERFTETFQDRSSDQLRELYWQSLNEIISRIRDSGKRVYVLYPVPELPMDIQNAAVPFSVFGGAGVLDLKQATTAQYYSTRNRFIIDKLDSLPYNEQLVAVKPFEAICDGQYCPAIKEGKALYIDDDHISIYGAELIVNSIDLNKVSSTELTTFGQ